MYLSSDANTKVPSEAHISETLKEFADTTKQRMLAWRYIIEKEADTSWDSSYEPIEYDDGIEGDPKGFWDRDGG